MCDISYVLRGLYCSLILNSLLPTEKEFRWALVFLRWSSVLLLLLLLLLMLLLGVEEQVFSHKVQNSLSTFLRLWQLRSLIQNALKQRFPT